MIVPIFRSSDSEIGRFLTVNHSYYYRISLPVIVNGRYINRSQIPPSITLSTNKLFTDIEIDPPFSQVEFAFAHRLFRATSQLVGDRMFYHANWKGYVGISANKLKNLDTFGLTNGFLRDLHASIHYSDYTDIIHQYADADTMFLPIAVWDPKLSIVFSQWPYSDSYFVSSSHEIYTIFNDSNIDIERLEKI